MAGHTQTKDNKFDFIKNSVATFAAGATAGLLLAYLFKPSFCQRKGNHSKVERCSIEDKPVLEEICRTFEVDAATLRRTVVKGMLQECKNGLSNKESTLKMLPTFVTKLPTGKETGFCFGIDFGGTNLRVLKVRMGGNGTVSDVQEFKREIPEEMMSVHGDKLFSFVANHMTESGVTLNEQAGFCFSFPIEKKSLSTGILTNWTKGFCNPGVEGEDVVNLLNVAMAKEQKTVGSGQFVDAIVNDTVGTLVSCAYSHPSCRLGIILGTGCNAAYVEKAANISRIESGEGDMIINSEWGNFGSSRQTRQFLPFSQADILLDRDSVHPGEQLFEKMTAGMYLGEIAARCLKQLIDAKEIWTTADRTEMALEKLTTPIMSEVEETFTDNSHLRSIVESLGVKGSTEEDIRVFKLVCQLVAKRAARLAAAGIAAFVEQMGNPSCVAGVDGSLFSKHPTFRASMVELLDELNCECTLEQASDGSGIGAALVAASASS